jgi:hypothetical protein
MNAKQPFETFPTIHQSTRPEYPGRPDYLIEKYPKNMILYWPSTAPVAVVTSADLSAPPLVPKFAVTLVAFVNNT